MAEILIKGMELPKEIQCCYTIFPNGKVIVHWDGKVLGEAEAIEVPTHGDWHTGKPTEDGDYFVAYHWGLDNKIMHDMASRILYGATTFENGNWKIDYPYSVVAWQKIEPYKETD